MELFIDRNGEGRVANLKNYIDRWGRHSSKEGTCNDRKRSGRNRKVPLKVIQSLAKSARRMVDKRDLKKQAALPMKKVRQAWLFVESSAERRQ